MKTISGFDFLAQKSNELIQGCITEAHDGTRLFTPDGIASYNALWVRDFAYMVEYGGDFLEDRNIEEAIAFIIKGCRADGWMPDRIYADGMAVYAAGEIGTPVGLANLDNTPFLVFIVYFYLNRIHSAKARSLFQHWESFLNRGMDIIPLSESGLVYNNPQAPHSPYGFTDTICKTGELFMESLLYWRSCQFLSKLYARFGNIKATIKFNVRSKKIEKNIFKLYNAEKKAFLAATHDCNQIDIWGNAYLLYIGFPAKKVWLELVSFLHDNYDCYCYKGQIRHLLQGEYWDRLLIDVPREEYQNGAYWATATGWVVWCLAQTDGRLAAKTVNDVISSFAEDGIYECLNVNYAKLDSFVVSAVNVYGAINRLLNHEANRSLIQAIKEI
ncbi:MAG TPA: hypothetical protein DDW65_09015 [Firmicutes bacterium]|nr:hypothetical protein [Bacillota bacterium]